MAEGFEVYHVPQQSRRDKLRIGATPNNFHISPGLLPLYDPSLISSDLLTCATVSGQDFPINQTPFDDINANPSLFHAGYGAGDDVSLFKHPPEPLSLELNLQRYGSSAIFSPAINGPHGSDSVPLGPLSGYVSVMKGSKFFKPAQQLLEELFDYGGRLGSNADKLSPNSGLMDPLLESLAGDIVAGDHDPMSCEDGSESRSKKSRLISMLDEVYRRYKLYYQQMQAVVTTFEYVAGLGNAAPYVNLAIRAMFKHFRLLKNAISDQLQFINKPYNPYCQRSIHGTGFLDHQPVWRPQRGLPESAVAVLRAWLFEHFLHPYPTDTDKLMLANQTGLSRSQVSNWFINARVRLWKPMVEEIHMLETRQAQKSQQREANGNRLNDLASSTNSLKHEKNTNASTSNQGHNRNELHNMTARNELLDLTNPGIFSAHPHAAAGASISGGSSAGSVSLTLGLHQNNGGIGLSESFPINAAQHFNIGLEATGEQGYVMSSFGTENRHFGRNTIGGQLLHDFVG